MTMVSLSTWVSEEGDSVGGQTATSGCLQCHPDLVVSGWLQLCVQTELSLVGAQLQLHGAERWRDRDITSLDTFHTSKQVGK